MGGFFSGPGAAGSPFTMYYAYGAIGTAPSIGFFDRGNIPGSTQFSISANGTGVYSINFNGLNSALGWLEWDFFLMPQASGLVAPSYRFTNPKAGDQYGIACFINGVAAAFAASFLFLARVNPPL